MSTIEKLEDWLQDSLVTRNRLQSNIIENKAKLKTLEQKFLDINEALGLVQQVAEQVQQYLFGQITSIVTDSLQSIFDIKIEFKMDIVQKRNANEVEIYFISEGERVYPKKNSAGGWLDVASFALRLINILLRKVPLRRTYILDEPFKNVSEEYLPGVCTLLETLTEQLNIQFIAVTHKKELEIGNIIQL